MSDLPETIDLKFLPDWLKEGESQVNRYADFAGEPEGRGGRDRDGGRMGRGPRPGGPRPGGPRPGGPGGPRPGGARPGGPRPGGARPGGPRPGGASPGGPRGDRRDGPRGDQRGPRRDDRPAPVRIQPANVKVEFIPEPAAVMAIAKQIRASHRAFPLFGTGRLFLDRPERHRLRITALDAAAPLYQLGENGPITTNREPLEREAFRQMKEKYYLEEVQQGEAPKGIFTNVARLRGSGLLLGPTNHHGYQPALRRLYEERGYSRRMPFAEFQQREVEVVNDEQTVNDWKEQARSTRTFTTTQEAEPLIFKTNAEVEAHFRQAYLPQLLLSGMCFEANGEAVRRGGDRALIDAIIPALEHERGFPVNIVNAMRPALNEAALHFFKHRKRIVFVTPVRPTRHPTGQPAGENILAILRAIEAHPRLSRHELAVKLLGQNIEAPELADQKTALATDLHYLILAGHVIEFSDGKLDLPLPPKTAASTAASTAAEHEPEPEAERAEAEVEAVAAVAAESAEPPAEAAEAPAEEATPEPVEAATPEPAEGSAPESAEAVPAAEAEEPSPTQ